MKYFKWGSFIFSLDPSRLLITLGASVNMEDLFHHNTPLHWAVLAKNNVVVTLLVNSGADVDAKNVQVFPCYLHNLGQNLSISFGDIFYSLDFVFFTFQG